MTYEQLPTPCYVVDEALIEKNVELLHQLGKRTGVKVLLAQKAFSMFALYPMMGKYLDGTTASGLYEARLGYEEMGKENHVFSAAYKKNEIEELIPYCDHIVFNSFTQLMRYKEQVLAAGKEVGLRINPECSTQEGHGIYDPCSKGSRLGITIDNFQPELLEGVSGLHFHTLCEQDADALEITLQAVEEKFGKYLRGMKWINFGGGHHITKENYDMKKLEACIKYIQDTHQLQVYIEPGEAVALNAGLLITTVLDIQYNDGNNVIVDTSAACHMPDVLEMPYTPPLMGAGAADEKEFTYRIGGPTCLAGDIIGTYSFDQPLEIGDRLVFEDMAIYTMVKNNTFNGMPLPAIIQKTKQGTYKLIKEFGYEDFKQRLS